jgi:hypothetical protein
MAEETTETAREGGQGKGKGVVIVGVKAEDGESQVRRDGTDLFFLKKKFLAKNLGGHMQGYIMGPIKCLYLKSR